MEPYIIDILCKPADPCDGLNESHAVVCAISDTPELAEAMARNLVMSHSFIVESVSSVILKNSSPLDEFRELEDILHHKATQRTPPCALFLSSHKPGLQESELHIVSDPTVNASKN